ncbi:MAG: hypothetical protein HOJ34_04345 [Kordiimonadaceae bacterium]|jgi:methylglutamate dehydrogenase subunit D|nr:hypothetical protein [Kordiimonadaceae bacterium]MBT6032641.1 hypothetical protein [Kordiimonadaceae bacterium]MBT6328993.1 hypothetical protein [Kordiimonadaceae bacterium]MBT7582083.1 hypothetical protein [Kordiimonadaceae bacterium]
MSDQLSIKEVRYQSMVLIKSWPDSAQKTDAILAAFLGIDALPVVGDFISQNDIYFAVISPGHFMMFSNNELLCSEISKLFSADIASVVDISHSRCGISLNGKNSDNLLNKGIAINLTDDDLPGMSVLQSSIHSIGIIMFKLQHDDYLIFSYSSFFDSFYAWVIDSAEEYGYALT